MVHVATRRQVAFISHVSGFGVLVAFHLQVAFIPVSENLLTPLFILNRIVDMFFVVDMVRFLSAAHRSRSRRLPAVLPDRTILVSSGFGSGPLQRSQVRQFFIPFYSDKKSRWIRDNCKIAFNYLTRWGTRTL